MSIQWVSWVLDHHPSKGSNRLVMIALANHADEHGQSYPSIDRIAREANLSRDTARKAVRACVREGWVTRQVNAAPDERIAQDRRPNLYRIVRAPRGGEIDPPVVVDGSLMVRGARSTPPSRHDRPPRGRARSTPPSRGYPQEQTVAAQAAMIERDGRRQQRSLEPCGLCDGDGWTETPAGLIRCDSDEHW